MITNFYIISAVALSMNFQSAFSFSKQDEQSLNTVQTSSLITAQGKIISEVFSDCTQYDFESAVKSFTVVARLDSSGYVEQTWNDKNDEFSLCVEEKIQRKFIFQPPKTPFFTAFEFKFEE
ncbi:hypothetical protein [Neisseria canis]|uniref:Uncharacterized protein n=1 Tax=Neisseria canis TaxID=493 RepID=A0A3S4PIZ8_9NEIS|nr:hypothetical protein [Neisseria canis]VEF02981.1 Uncharacterised protein [Neisseria canis]